VRDYAAICSHGWRVPGDRGAAHVTRLTVVNNRIVVNSMEARAAVADYDKASDRFTSHSMAKSITALAVGGPRGERVGTIVLIGLRIP